jgi:ribosome maturation factor RimP
VLYRLINHAVFCNWNLAGIVPCLTFAAEIDERRERGRSLLLLYSMNNDPQIKLIEQRIKVLISAEPDLFLVEVKIKPTNNIKVYIDGDQGVSIEKLVNYNRKLYKQIEEEGLYPDGDFSLEVSSPGLDEPLKMHRQYQKNIGRFAEVIDKEGQRKEGKLVSVGEQELLLEEIKGKGKKQETITHTISFEDIKSTKILIKF